VRARFLRVLSTNARLTAQLADRSTSLCATLLACLFLAACASQTAAPVSDRSVAREEKVSGYRIVIPGDTLYSIAWEAGHDYRELAEWNDIDAPFTLHPGQKLRLTASPKKALKVEKRAPPKKEVAPATHKESKSTAKHDTGSDQQKNSSKMPATKPKSLAQKAPAKRQASAETGPWTWPADGKLLNWQALNSKGLDIAGVHGQSVRAAASGRVVYVGSGLRGYGLLIILKHSDEYLSAYAHSEKVYVKEGDMIKRGEKIADMGSSGTDRVKLHFEIRRHGVPVDPLLYLPKK